MGFATVFEQIFIIFILMAIGYVASKAKALSAGTTKEMTNLLIYLIGPSLIIHSFQRPFDVGQSRALLASFGLNIIFMLSIILLGKLVFNKKVVTDTAYRKELQFSAVYSNFGFMGIPLLYALFGANGVFFGTAYMAVALAYMWTHGVNLFRHETGRAMLVKTVTNPNIIALVLGLTLYLNEIVLPSVIHTTLGYIVDLNTPLSMMVVGSNIAAIRLSSIFTDKLVWLGVLVRNVFIPSVVVLTLAFLPLGELDPVAVMAIVIMNACPVAAFTTLFAKISNMDELFPTKLVSLSTLFSIFTLPLMIELAMQIIPYL